eukprot:TRINITY_DN5765_c0_g1_i1.p1 TRINITY_DN5765_c0_g1~~TRINITY_DN5765_c0_g1_i1.p1  ORF type:complete len:453 (+),score=44.55 TRINITY_DN5765_c0_g1_i1:83-1441(+)
MYGIVVLLVCLGVVCIRCDQCTARSCQKCLSFNQNQTATCMWDSTILECTSYNTSTSPSYVLDTHNCSEACIPYVFYCKDSPVSWIMDLVGVMLGLFSTAMAVIYYRLGFVKVSSRQAENLLSTSSPSSSPSSLNEQQQHIFRMMGMVYSIMGVFSICMVTMPMLSLTMSVFSLIGSGLLLYNLHKEFKNTSDILNGLCSCNTVDYVDTSFTDMKYLPFQRFMDVLPDDENVVFHYESSFEGGATLFIIFFPICFLMGGMAYTFKDLLPPMLGFFVGFPVGIVILIVVPIILSRSGVVLTDKAIYILSHSWFNPFSILKRRLELTDIKSINISSHISIKPVVLCSVSSLNEHKREIEDTFYVQVEDFQGLDTSLLSVGFTKPHPFQPKLSSPMIVAIFGLSYFVLLLIYIIGCMLNWGILFQTSLPPSSFFVMLTYLLLMVRQSKSSYTFTQ